MIASVQSPPSILTLILVTGLSTLSLNLFIPSLSNIADTCRADHSVTSLSIAGYLGMTVVLQVIMRSLSDRFGRRLVVLSGLAIFNMASIGCLPATAIWTFLAFHMILATVICGAGLSSARVSGRRMASERNGTRARVPGYPA